MPEGGHDGEHGGEHGGDMHPDANGMCPPGHFMEAGACMPGAPAGDDAYGAANELELRMDQLERQYRAINNAKRFIELN